MNMSVKPMILITASWNGKRSFKMIPVTKECIYNECIFDEDARILAVVSKEHKNNFHTIPILDEFGKQRSNHTKRVVLDTYYEYFIEDKEEIIKFINLMADNADVFDFKSLIETAFVSKEA